MKYKKTKIFPLKVSDSFYSDLKYVAKNEGIPVSVFVRNHLEPIVEKGKRMIEKKDKKIRLIDSIKKHAFTSKTRYEDKSVDEILYGGKLHEDEK